MLDFQQVQEIDTSDFQKIINIYIDAFPENQRLSVELLSQRIKTNIDQLFVGYWQQQAISMAILHSLDHDFIFLVYLAIDKDYRSQGIGKKFLEYILNYCAGLNKSLILEVDDPDFGNEKDIRIKRINFYKKLGAKELRNVKYVLPPLTGKILTQQKLMIIPASPESLMTRELLIHLIKQFYRQVYYRDEKDVFLNSFIHQIPSLLELI